ncbi:hypothetical protein [Luteolibacter sp. Populi]|uniref:hypothetical protein n=1 Tax=Luteolibacter sp. Populi TaxID=3230487 RepID=UPI003465C845
MRIFALLLVFTCKLLAVDPAPPPDPEATAAWIASNFTIRDGEVQVAGKTPNDCFRAKLALKADAEIWRISNTGLLVDQKGLFPLACDAFEDAYRFSLCTPFYDYLDRMTTADDLPGYADNPKNQAITGKALRRIAAALHTHFTKACGTLPRHYRTQDDLTYPSECYIWQVGKCHLKLYAYRGNDSHGIGMTVSTDAAALEAIGKRQPTKQEIFEDWGEPLPHLPAE